MNCNDVISSLRNAKEEIHRKYRVKEIGIFGSVARGTAKDESDIDIYAEFEQEADILDFSGLSLELEEMFHRPIDIATPQGIREEMRAMVFRDLILV
ncbi:MAG TPA: nucleotidyltransferase family protein [Methanospirillum sp.]|nr:nucleotidyltransferase family protein [Methanospirillum sp.]